MGQNSTQRIVRDATRGGRRSEAAAPMVVAPSAVEQRIAIGVEIATDSIRIVRLSRDLERVSLDEPMSAVRVDDVAIAPLRPNIVCGTDILDLDALSRVLGQMLGEQLTRMAQLGLPACHALSLSLCPSVVVTCDLPIEQLVPGFPMLLPEASDMAAADALAPWVLSHAHDMTGIDASELLVDWYCSQAEGRDRVIIAATMRHYLCMRQRMVGEAGATLRTLSDTATAALDACRYVVGRLVCLPPTWTPADPLSIAPIRGARFHGHRDAAHAICGSAEGPSALHERSHAPIESAVAEVLRAYPTSPFDRVVSNGASLPGVRGATHEGLRFAALWLGERSAHVWSFAANGEGLIGASLPALEDVRHWLEALTHADIGSVSLALVMGEPSRLAQLGGVSAIKATLHCPVIEFDASACCTGPGALPHLLGITSAVAFGLALRDVFR